MELAAKPGIGLMANTLVGTVIHIDKEFLPIGTEGLGVDCIAVVLARHETPVCANHAHWLVVGTVTVFQFVDACAR